MHMMPTLDLKPFKIGEGAEPEGNDVFRDRPPPSGADGEYRAADAPEEGKDLFFGKAGSRAARLRPRHLIVNSRGWFIGFYAHQSRVGGG